MMQCRGYQVLSEIKRNRPAAEQAAELMKPLKAGLMSPRQAAREVFGSFCQELMAGYTTRIEASAAAEGMPAKAVADTDEEKQC